MVGRGDDVGSTEILPRLLNGHCGPQLGPVRRASTGDMRVDPPKFAGCAPYAVLVLHGIVLGKGSNQRSELIMRSRRAFIGATIIVLSYPTAVAVGLLFGQGGDTVLHLMMGTGFVIFATSVFDFGLPRWVNIIGASAAGAFGAIFLMQGASDLTHLEGLRHLAFDILGHELERLLPDVVYVWFVALLLWSSHGKSRALGWIVMSIVVGVEIATLACLLLGVPMASVKVLIFLPFVWLLFESVKQRPTRSVATRGEPRYTNKSTAH